MVVAEYNSVLIATFGIVVAVASVYLFAYAVYRRPFIGLVGLAWLLNGFYLLIETAGGSDVLEYVSSLPSTYLFYLAFLEISHGTRIRSKRAVIELCLWTAAIVMGIVLGDSRTGFGFAIQVTLGVLFTGYVLLGIGTRIRKLSPEELLCIIHQSDLPGSYDSMKFMIDESKSVKVARAMLSTSFYGYGVLQFSYLFYVSSDFFPWIASLFLVALILKLANGMGLLLLIFADFRHFSVMLARRSATEELGLLTASIEHDIRNPLGIIFKKIKIAKRTHAGKEVVQDLDYIERQVRRIRAAIEVIPISRESSYKNWFAPLNLVDVVVTAVRDVKEQMEDEEMRIALDTATQVITIQGYRERLILCFVSVLKNAIEATWETASYRKPQIKVYCGIYQDTRQAVVSVWDNGPGIPQDALKMVKRPMYSTKNAKDIRGIGLFITNRIVEMHGGKLDISSDGTSYTEVQIKLPLHNIAIQEGRDAQIERRISDMAVLTYPESSCFVRLLILDDDRAFVQSVLEFLEGAGLFDIVVAHDIKTADEMVKESAFDLVIVDVLLEGEETTGDEWLLANTERLAEAKKVVLTGFPERIKSVSSLRSLGVTVVIKGSFEEARYFEHLGDWARTVQARKLESIVEELRKLTHDHLQIPHDEESQYWDLVDRLKPAFLEWFRAKKLKAGAIGVPDIEKISPDDVWIDVKKATKFGALMLNEFLSEIQQRFQAG